MYENCFKISELQKSFTMYKWVIMYMMGERKKKKGSSHAKVKVLFKDYIFHMAVFIDLNYIFHTIF
jgi:hypothetical protein